MNLNATLLGQMITFAIFVGITMKFIWPNISQALAQRRKKIADGLAAAERGQNDLELAQHKAKEIIREAKAQASVIIEQANHRAHHIEEEAKEQTRHITENMKIAAQADIDSQKNKARQELIDMVAELSIVGAERLLKRNIDRAANEALLQELVKEVK